MEKPIIVDADDIAEFDVTYESLSDEAMKFLAKCGQLTMKEQMQHGMKHPAISANECLGMATRIIAEQSKMIQVLADSGQQ